MGPTVLSASSVLHFDAWVDSVFQISPTVFAISSVDGAVKLLDVTTASWIDCNLSFPDNRVSFSSISFDDVTFVALTSDAFHLVDVRSPGGIVSTHQAPNNFAYATCTPTATPLFATGTQLSRSDALVEIWDLRASKKLHTYSELHSDDISSLGFHQDGPFLLSASTDGLFSVVDCRVTDEDDAVLGVGNMNASVKSAVWLSPVYQGSNVLCLSDMVTASVFTSQEPTVVKEYGDLRQVAYAPSQFKADYGIGLQQQSFSANVCAALYLGSNENGVLQLYADANGKLKPHRCLQGGHVSNEVVRSAVQSLNNDAIVTGGEDALVAVWSCASDRGQMETDAPAPTASHEASVISTHSQI